MRRIRPKEVVEAYIKTGMRPIFNNFISDNGREGCGISVILKSMGHDVVFASCESSTDYQGFIGHRDGLEARKAVLAYMEEKAAPTCQLPAEALSVAPVPSSEAVAS